MPQKETFSVRLTQDMSDAIEEYADENDVSQAEALRRAVRDQYLRATPDGGEVQERFDALERRQERQEKADTALNTLNAAGIIYIVAYFTGYLPDTAGLAVGAILFGALVTALAYSAGWWGGSDE